MGDITDITKHGSDEDKALMEKWKEFSKNFPDPITRVEREPKIFIKMLNKLQPKLREYVQRTAVEDPVLLLGTAEEKESRYEHHKTMLRKAYFSNPNEPGNIQEYNKAVELLKWLSNYHEK